MHAIHPKNWQTGTALLCVWAAGAAHAAAQEARAVELLIGRSLPHEVQGPFVQLSDGALVAIERRDALVSRDRGRTWEKRPLFSEEQFAKHPLSIRKERALLLSKEGTIIAAFLNDAERKWTWNDELLDAPGAILPTYVMRSTDGGRTWRDVQKLQDDWSGAVRDMIQTKQGRIIFTTMKMMHNPGRHAVVTYWSDDDGVTWRSSNVIDLGGVGNHGGVTEPCLVELEDGRVWLVIRTNWGEFWSGYSYDGGKNWRVLQPSGIAASSAPAIVKRLASGRLVMLWNRPHAEGKPIGKLTGGNNKWSEVPVSNYRAELSLAFSGDDGRTWTKPQVVARHVGPERPWIAYPYLLEIEPGVLWVTTMQGGLRAELNEAELLPK